MDPLEKMDILARRARQERAPLMPINMGAVLRVKTRETMSLQPMAWAAGISAVAAAVVLVVTLRVSTASTSSQTDSVTSLFSPTQLEMP